MSRLLVGVVALSVAAGCSSREVQYPARSPSAGVAPVAAAAAVAPPPAMAAGSAPLAGLPPLPPGWVWPSDVQSGVAAASQAAASVASQAGLAGLVRPVDVSRLLPAAGTGPCAPIQVAPNVWISLPCGGTPRLGGSSAIPRRKGLLSTVNLPPQVDLRANGLDGPVLDQQMVGVCWTFALADVMDNSLRRQGYSDVVAPMHVLASDTWDQMWQSGKSTDNLTTERQLPYDPVEACKLNESKSEVWCGQAYHVQPGSWRGDPALVASVSRADAEGTFHVAAMQQLDTPVDTDQLAAILATGQSVYADMNIDTDAWGYRATRSGTIPDYANGNAGHGIAFVGYRGAGPSRQFLVHNSWGPKWANNGYAWLSDAMVRAHAIELFTVEVGMGQGVAPKPAPAPAPAPATGCTTRDLVFGTCAAACPGGNAPIAGICATVPTQGCASGQARDWVTGQCAALCSNGLAPAAGVCAPW